MSKPKQTVFHFCEICDKPIYDSDSDCCPEGDCAEKWVKKFISAENLNVKRK